LTNGPRLLQAEVQNLFKNHNLPRVDTLVIAAPATSIVFETPTRRLPADGVAMMPIPARIENVNKLAEGWYLKINYRRGDTDSLLVQSTMRLMSQKLPE